MENKYAASTLTVNLKHIADNYNYLKQKAGSAVCSAVVKADAYGLGIDKVAPVLQRAGCDMFFVANLDEAVNLRSILPNSQIAVFNGVIRGQEKVFVNEKIYPVLNSLEQIYLWINFCKVKNVNPPCLLHIDTGMNRLGISEDAISKFDIDGLNILYIISHLACADDVENQMSASQLAAFKNICTKFSGYKISIANSSGIFLGDDFHLDMIRPGSALYGINPDLKKINPMKSVVSLFSCILQLHVIDSNQTVGYGATVSLPAGSKIATVPVGYADGYFRALSNKACGFIGDCEIKLVGRVSMDLVMFDVTNVPENLLYEGASIELIGDNISVCDIGKMAGTIGYEVITSLGSRYKRIYQED